MKNKQEHIEKMRLLRTSLEKLENSRKGIPMKHRIPVIISFLAVVTLAMGCNQRESKPSAGVENREASTTNLGQIKKETKAAVQTTEGYAYAKKEEFIKKMKTELADIQQELTRLSAKIESSDQATRAEAKVKFQQLHERASQLNKELDQAKSATESTWDKVKTGFMKSHNDFKNSLRQTRQWLSKKIAP